MFAGLEDNIPPHNTIEDMATDFITEIRAVQKSGPYLLGGHCLGGHIAFEIAVQLEAVGEKVAIVVQLEAVPPLADKADRSWHDDGSQYSLTRRSDGAEVSIRASLNQMNQQLSLLPADKIDHFTKIAYQHIYMGDKYRTAPISANIAQFRTSEHQSNTYGSWEYFSKTRYTEQLVTGSTYSMLALPHVATLGKALDMALQNSL
jgi:thioesterase domain-containing protein